MTVVIESVPKLHNLPDGLTGANAVEIELEQGVLIFRASRTAQNRIENLLSKQRDKKLSEAEKIELELYEEVDDYLSFLNRLTRNLAESQNKTINSGSSNSISSEQEIIFQ